MDTPFNPNRMLFADAIPIFVELNRTGALVDGNTGAVRRRTDGRVKQIVSAVRTTLERLPEVDDADGVDLRTYQNTLPAIALRTAEQDGHSSPRSKSSDVALFLRAVLRVQNGRYASGPRPDTALEQMPLAWQPLFRIYVEQVDGRPVGNSSYRPGMMGFIDAMVVSGVTGPSDLPPDREGLLERLSAAGVPPDKQGALLTAYRHAIKCLGLSLPRYLPPPSPCERGLRSVRGLHQLCQQGIERRLREEPDWTPPLIEHFEDWHPRDLLQCLAPEISGDLEEYMAWADDNNGRSEGTVDCAIDAVSSIVAELIRLDFPEEIWTLTTLQLFQERSLAKGLQAVTSRVMKRAGANCMQPLSLARIALDAASQRSLSNSILDVHTTQTNATVVYYTHAIRNQFSALLSVVEYVHGAVLGVPAQDPQGWDRFRKEVTSIVNVIKAINSSAATDGHKNVTLLPITWAQAVFVGLHQLRKDVKNAQATYWVASERHAGERTAPVRRAFSAYSTALRLYLTAAFYLADGMRGRNYGYGRWNVNFLPEWEVRDGTPHRISAMRTEFSGADLIARPKKATTTRGDGSQQIHTRSTYINSALVDLELVTDYVLHVRPRDLVRAGVLEDIESYDVMTDAHAFLVNPKKPLKANEGRQRARSTNRAMASYSLPHLSKQFGMWLLHVARDILDLKDTQGKPLPSDSAIRAKTPEGRALRKRWRGLFNGHSARHLITSYIGGWCDLWPIAMGMTDDTERTLKSVYLQNYAAYFESLRFQSGLYHPDHFKALTIALFTAPVSLDWDSFDPNQPLSDKALIRVAGGSERPARCN